MSVAHPTPDPGSASLRQLRRTLAALHDELRNDGFTPIEAAQAAVRGLAGDSNLGLSPSVQSNLRAVAGTGADPVSLLALLYQEFLVAEARSGLGQYLTPLPVADLIAKVLRTRSRSSPTVLDPFSGSGILLHRFAEKNPNSTLKGLEINYGIASISRALATLGDYHLDVETCDSFEHWRTDSIGTVDLVVTNPPFGATVSQGTVESLRSYVPQSLRSMKRIPAELLGLELSISALEPNGRIGIVLPNSVLTNSTWAVYRKSVIERLEIDGIVSLPEETFATFRGVAKACVLFGTRRNGWTSGYEDPPVFRSRSVGYTDTGRASELPSDMDQAASCMTGGEVPKWRLAIDGGGQMTIYDCSISSRTCQLKLGDIAHIFTGRTPSSDDYRNEGPFVLKVGNLQGSFVSWSTRRRSHISHDAYCRWSKLHLQTGDICLTAAAHRPRYIGRKVDLVYELPTTGAIPSAEVMVIRLHPDAPLLPEELLFYLRSEEGYQQLQDRVRGSTAHLYARDVLSLAIPPTLPSMSSDAVGLYRKAARLHREAVAAERSALRAAGLEANWDSSQTD